MAPHRRRRARAHATIGFLGIVPALLAGCASPGPPRAPSLQLPSPVTDLVATRAGESVALHFTLPTSTTDGQPLLSDHLTGSLCRQAGAEAPCLPVDAADARAPLPLTGERTPVIWHDSLPAGLRTGPPRVLAYRVELRNATGRTAGFSEPAYVAGGLAPPGITDLQAFGVRQGIELRWTPAPEAGEVLLERTGGAAAKTPPAEAHRTELPHAPAHQAARNNGVRWLQANPGDQSAAATLDTSAEPGVPYTYLAVRRMVVQAGGRTLELRSAPSQPVHFTWRDIYPPAAPTGLTALGYTVSASSQAGTPDFAVDLVWQPVLDDRLAGYLVYRQTLPGTGAPSGPEAPLRLTPQPIATPGFHDATAHPDVRYRYSVTAVDPAGNESLPAATEVLGAGS